MYSVKVALLAERAVVEYDPMVWTPEKIMAVSQASSIIFL
jgi:Cu+-exporting ATPase